jgi:hypothetical protein
MSSNGIDRFPGYSRARSEWTQIPRLAHVYYASEGSSDAAGRRFCIVRPLAAVVRLISLAAQSEVTRRTSPYPRLRRGVARLFNSAPAPFSLCGSERLAAALDSSDDRADSDVSETGYRCGG